MSAAMLNLIRKDFISSRMVIGIATLAIPFLTSLALWAMMDDFGGIALGFITFLTIGLCLTASLIFLLVDSNTGADTTYAGFPLKRSELVTARYITSCVLLVYSLLLTFFTIWVVSVTTGKTDKAFSLLLSFRGVTGIFTLLLLILSFLFPFIFKFGISKGLVICFSVLMFISLMDPLSNFILNALSGIIVIDLTIFKTVFEDARNLMISLPASEVYFLMMLVLLTVVCLSLFLSIKLYSTRDL